MAKQNIKDPGAHHNSSGALIRRFLPYLAKHKAVLFLDLFCAALTTLCDIFLPKIMSTITNSAMGVGITLTTGIVLKLAGIYSPSRRNRWSRFRDQRHKKRRCTACRRSSPGCHGSGGRRYPGSCP